MHADPASIELGTVIGDAFQLEALIGRGGFGAVFRATGVTTGRRVALKILARRALDAAGGIGRFHREADLASRLRHPSSVRVLGTGEDTRGWLYIAFELLEGQGVDALLIARGAMHPYVAASVAIEALSALEEAHALGIVHRDLKPANLFLARTLEGERVKVLDFGLAKSTNPGTAAGLTREGSTVGTPIYMAPEQIRGEEVSGRCDLFSLGIVLGELVHGSSPYAGLTPMKVMTDRIMGERVPIPRDLDGSPLRAIVERATETDPARRFANASEMRAALVEARAAIPPPNVATSNTLYDPKRLTPSTAGGLSEFVTGPTAVGLMPAQSVPVQISSALASPPLQGVPSAPPQPTRSDIPGSTSAPHPNLAPPSAPLPPPPRTEAKRSGAKSGAWVLAICGVVGLGALSFVAYLIFNNRGDTSSRDKHSTSDTSHQVTKATSNVPFAYAATIPQTLEAKLGAVRVISLEIFPDYASVLIEDSQIRGRLDFYEVRGHEVTKKDKAATVGQTGRPIGNLPFSKIPAMIEDARRRAKATLEQVRAVVVRVNEPPSGLPAFSVMMTAPGAFPHADYDEKGQFLHFFN